MDKFIVKRKHDNSEKSDNDEPQEVSSVSISIPTCAGPGPSNVNISISQPTGSKLKVAKTVKTDTKVKFRYYDDSYIQYRFVSNM